MKGQTSNRFAISHQPFGPHEIYRLLDRDTGMSVDVLPSGGCTITSLHVPVKAGTLEVIDGYSSFEDFRDNLETSFKGSSLCPFPNRVAGGRYAFEGEPHQLPLNFPHENNAIHGLIYNREFTVPSLESSDSSCTLTARLDAKAEQGFPFPYTLVHHFTLDPAHGFTCTTEITNRSTAIMPAGLGWHPYFRLGSETIDELEFQFPAADLLDVDEVNIPTGHSSPYDAFSSAARIGNTELDSCFLLTNTGVTSEIVLVNRQREASIRLWMERGESKYNFLQVYTPPHRNSIAIEPMTCAPDAFNNRMGLISLAPGQVTTASWGISMDTHPV